MALRGMIFVTLLVVTLTSHVTQADVLMPGVRRVRQDSSRIIFPTSPVHPHHVPAPVPVHSPVHAPVSAPVPVDQPGTVDNNLELPEDISLMGINDLLRLNSLTNISDFASLFSVELPSPEKQAAPVLSISTRFGGGEVVESSELAEMANCNPELVTVALDLPQDRNAMYFPTCVRLEQCGGCCYGPLLTCRPTDTKIVRFKVLKTVLGGDNVSSSSGGRRRNSNGSRGRTSGRRRRRQTTATYVEVEAVKHTSCACGCRVQEQDCDPAIHTYYEGECACVCKNRDEKRKCEQQNTTKYWDNETCSCYCRKPSACSSGQFFSQTSCRCELLTARSGLGIPVGVDEGS